MTTGSGTTGLDLLPAKDAALFKSTLVLRRCWRPAD